MSSGTAMKKKFSTPLNPVDEILQEVENNEYDMVVMGAHGHGALADAIMGSVSRRVVRRCKKPVLVIRLPDDD